MKKIALAIVLVSTMMFAGEQFAMSDSDRAMYAEMLENNPAEIMIESGNELVQELVGGDEGIANFLEIKEDSLPKYIAGFPRYIKKLGSVVGIDQVLQALLVENGHKPFKLKSKDMFNMSSYVKSLANEERINIDVNANSHIKKAYSFGKEIYEVKRGGRGLACLSCHSKDVTGTILRTQPLPNLGETVTGGTWPAYRMTKSSLRTLQRRFQGCMNNSLQAILPIGSKEMVALEVYVTNMAKGKEIAIPGLKR